MQLYMFRTIPLSIIRSFPLYTQQWYMSYRFADSLRASSGWNTLISQYLFLEWNSTCFGQFLCPSSGVNHCTYSSGLCHTVFRQLASKLSAKLYYCSSGGYSSTYVWLLLTVCGQGVQQGWHVSETGNCFQGIMHQSLNLITHFCPRAKSKMRGFVPPWSLHAGTNNYLTASLAVSYVISGKILALAKPQTHGCFTWFLLAV